MFTKSCCQNDTDYWTIKEKEGWKNKRETLGKRERDREKRGKRMRANEFPRQKKYISRED